MKDWSAFGTDVKRHVTGRGPKCRIAVLLDDLNADDRGHVEAVLANRGISNSAIQRALRERLGEDAPGLFSVSNHRRGNCRCAS